ncbi:MAG TPA: DEAD/DEAH box helicase, partial [Polyangiaceae bacterium]
DLLAWRAVPAWQHMLGAFEEAARGAHVRPAGEEERVAFRLSRTNTVPAVLLQRVRRGGGAFTAGRQVDAREALSLRSLTALERETLETILLLGISDYYHREHSRTRLRLLDLLADHPRVFLEGDGKGPVRLRRARATLRVNPVDASFRVEVGIGAAVMSPAAALGAARTMRILLAPDPKEESVYFAEIDDVSLALFSALAAHPESLPERGLDALLGVLASFPDLKLDLELPEALRGKPVTADTRVVVQLSLAVGGGLVLALRIRPLPGGLAVLPGAPPKHLYGASDQARIFVTRDLDDEEVRAENLLAELPLAGALRRGPFDLRIDDPERACDIVATLAELGDTIVSEWPDGQRLRVASTLRRRALKLRIERKRDWFGIEGGAEIEGSLIGIHALLEATRAGRRFVRLANGALVAIGRDLRASLERALDVVHDGRDGVVAYPPAASAISELVESDEQVAGDTAWLELRARLRRAETIEPILPSGLMAELRPYQEQGYAWLMRLAECGAGACLADDMGLGKTLQSLAVLEARKGEGPALVVAPTSVCVNWPLEAARFTPSLEVMMYRGADRGRILPALKSGSVLLTNYDLMLRDIDALASVEFATVIFDEAHALKNGNSKRSGAARRIRAGFRVALSGTPIENHTGELWSLFRVVVPGLFGSWEHFRKRFAAPIERERDPARRAALSAIIRPYLLRRTKGNVAPELPPRTEVVRFVDLSTAERDLYEAERLRALELLNGAAAGEDGRFAILAALTRLRQLACHPRLRHADSIAPSSKLASVLALVDELREAGHRALVFSQFTTHLALLAEALAARGVTYVELDGATPAVARAERIRRFQAGEADLFLISLKAGGVGLNLTAADYVLHLDPWWNPAAEDQATDRAHRIGQDKPVTVVRFISRATIEESVLALHAEKRELAQALLDGGDLAGRLTSAELLSLMEKGARSEALDSSQPESPEDDEEPSSATIAAG